MLEAVESWPPSSCCRRRPGRRRGAARAIGSLVENADWPGATGGGAEKRTEEENLRVASRWFLTNDITPLPHMFRIRWLYWQMRGRMPEGRAWIDEVQRRADALDDRAQAELLFTSAVTAVEVGDDESALAAVEGLERLQGRIDDPYLESAAHLAPLGILPTRVTLDERCRPRRPPWTVSAGNEPFMAFAALTVGMTEIVGRDDARAHHRGQPARRMSSTTAGSSPRRERNWLCLRARAPR
jgi:hypothetical protein